MVLTAPLLARIVRALPVAIAVPALIMTSAGEYSCRLAVAEGYVSDFQHDDPRISYTFGFRRYYVENKYGGRGRCVRTPSHRNERWERLGYKFAYVSTYCGAMLCLCAILWAFGKSAEMGSAQFEKQTSMCGMFALLAGLVSLVSIQSAFSALDNPICSSLQGGQGCALGPMGRVALAGSACWMAAGLAMGVQWNTMRIQLEGRNAELRWQRQHRRNETLDERERLVFDGLPVYAVAYAVDAEHHFVVPTLSVLAGEVASKDQEEEEEESEPGQVLRVEMVELA